MKFLFSNDLDIWASTYLKRSQTRFKCLSHDDEYKMWLEKKMFSPSNRCWNGNRAAEQRVTRRTSKITQVFFIFDNFMNGWLQALEQVAKQRCLVHGFIYRLCALSTYDQMNIQLFTIELVLLLLLSNQLQLVRNHLQTRHSYPLWSNEYGCIYSRISGAVVIVQSAATNSKSSSNPPFMFTSGQTNTVVYSSISCAVVTVQSAAANSKSSSIPPFMSLLQAARSCLFQ